MYGETLNKKFVKGGFKPNLFIFDNEFSGEFRTAVDSENIKLQLVTPHMHHNNPAERAIQTWTDHFLAGLASTHPDFPIREWDRLILQCNVTFSDFLGSILNSQHIPAFLETLIMQKHQWLYLDLNSSSTDRMY